MQRKTIPLPLLYALIAIGALAGLFAAHRRYEVEQLNRRVETALEFAEVKQLSQLTGQPLDRTLARFKDAGITSVAVTEETIGGLESRGDLRVQPGGHLVNVSSLDLLTRIEHALREKGLDAQQRAPVAPNVTTFAVGAQPSTLNPQPSMAFSIPADYATLRPLGIGLDPDAVATVKQAGLQPVGRIGNFVGASPVTMTNVLADLKRQGIQTVIFQGLEVLGFRGAEKDAAAALDQVGLYYGQVEFGKQKGDEKLGAALKGRYVRVHSIGDGEMGTMDENEAIERFVRAARERNIRLCYIRLLTTAGPDPIQKNVEYIEKIAKGIERGKHHEMELAAPAHLFGDPGVHTWVFALIALGVAGGLALLLMRLAPVSSAAAWGTLLLGAVVCVGLAVGMGETGRKLVALLAALVFPTLACLRRDILGGSAAQRPNDPATQRPASNGHAAPTPVLPWPAAAGRAVRGIIVASAVTSLGIISVVGLLASQTFITKANQFLGIKAAHAVPILIIGALVIAGLPRLDNAWPVEWRRMKERLAAFWSEPTRVGQLLLALIALVALALVVARTGNDPGVGVSGIELKFRALLDTYLPVRPRTKEFLIGHPAFILALGLWFRGRRRWAVPLYVVGVIGQVSILNTFCHTHTPLHLSLIRDITGLVLGALIGLALFWVVDRLLPKQAAEAGARPLSERAPEPATPVPSAATHG